GRVESTVKARDELLRKAAFFAKPKPNRDVSAHRAGKGPLSVPIVFIARVLGFGRAGLYAWRKRRDTPGPGARWRERLTTKIQELFDASDGTSGARRLQA